MDKVMVNGICIAAAMVAAASLTGCLSVKTEHEVKPIEINMNINLKVDKQLDEIVSKQDKTDDRKIVDALLDKGVVGIDRKSMFVPRGAVSSEDMEAVMRANAHLKETLERVAKENGRNYDDLAKTVAEKIVASRTSKGGAIWYQKPDGAWVQSK